MQSVLNIALPLCKDKINTKFAEGKTFLHYAIQEKADQYIIDLLLKNGADQSVPNAKNQMPLDFAKHYNHALDILKFHHNTTKSTIEPN